jgi:hypothetical protein
MKRIFNPSNDIHFEFDIRNNDCPKDSSKESFEPSAAPVPIAIVIGKHAKTLTFLYLILYNLTI